MIGAAVFVVGNTSTGVMTDLDGKYTLSVPSNSSIAVSCIGYSTQTITVGSESVYNVVLQEDTQLLEETVVIGYGVQKKSDLTGSVASVDADALKNQSVTDAAAALQGKASGVHIINSGAPGSGAEIRVRGYSSNSGNIGPLLIVDGLQVDNIQYLDPSMIESMEVLKDAASAAIYGAQAGNGVVLITTKMGSAEKAEGLKALNRVQQRSGSNKISSELTLQTIMEEKQYEMWFENCRFHDLVRWSKQYPSVVDLNKVFNKSGIHQKVPTVFDTYFVSAPGYEQYKDKEHKLYTTYSSVPGNSDFQVGKNEYFPFPRDFMNMNPALVNVGGWASAQ